MSQPPITFDLADGVARLTLARPDRRNAIDAEFAQSLSELAERCANDPSVRCVVLTGSGTFFSVGGDITSFAEAGGSAEKLVAELAQSFHAGIHRLCTMGKPLITSINGPAAGAGLSLAIVGDIAVSAASAHFTSAYSAVGLTPDGGASWWLPRLIGLRRAQEMVLTNRRVGADEAAAIGLITRVVEDDNLVAATDELAATLAAGPVRALGRCRALLRESYAVELAVQLDLEARFIALAAGDPDGREGVAAFLARRSPTFGLLPE